MQCLLCPGPTLLYLSTRDYGLAWGELAAPPCWQLVVGLLARFPPSALHFLPSCCQALVDATVSLQGPRRCLASPRRQHQLLSWTRVSILFAEETLSFLVLWSSREERSRGSLVCRQGVRRCFVTLQEARHHAVLTDTQRSFKRVTTTWPLGGTQTLCSYLWQKKRKNDLCRAVSWWWSGAGREVGGAELSLEREVGNTYLVSALYWHRPSLSSSLWHKLPAPCQKLPVFILG